MVDLYELGPLILGAVFLAIIIVVLLNYVLKRKVPPTDEPLIGDYRIELDVGTHIIPLEGGLYYFTKLLNPKHIHTLAQSLDIKDKVTELQKELKERNVNFYAMRDGLTKLAIISLEHPLETAPYFKIDEKTRKKIVHASGTVGKTVGGLKAVVFQPIDQSKNTLNPADYQNIDKLGELLLTVKEKAPLVEEMLAEKEKTSVLQGKVNELTDDVGKLKDEVEYYKHLMKKQGITGEAEEGIKIPSWLKSTLLYGGVFLMATGIGFGIKVEELANIHPAILGGAVVIVTFMVKKIFGK